MAKCKLKSRDEVAALCSAWRASKKKIGFTSGVFDLLHPGHVDYLEQARASCDVLVVGVNSDSSVKAIKGPQRPICPEHDRAAVVAGLGSVEVVFVFSEQNNNVNVELLKPDFYIKAGDYQKEGLSSAALVESYGGKVVLVPLKEGFSSSKLIKRISDLDIDSRTISIELPPYPRMPAIFLDRDGTIVEHVEYLHEISKLKIISGAFEALKKLRVAGFRLIIITNQPGIGIGYFSKEEFFAVNRAMLKLASNSGVDIDRIYFCPHSRADHCECRKPAPGLIHRAVEDLNLDLSRSYVIGDMSSDIKLGKDAGCKTILVKTGLKGTDGLFDVRPDWIAEDLCRAAELILRV